MQRQRKEENNEPSNGELSDVKCSFGLGKSKILATGENRNNAEASHEIVGLPTWKSHAIWTWEMLLLQQDSGWGTLLSAKQACSNCKLVVGTRHCHGQKGLSRLQHGAPSCKRELSALVTFGKLVDVVLRISVRRFVERKKWRDVESCSKKLKFKINHHHYDFVSAKSAIARFNRFEDLIF